MENLPATEAHAWLHQLVGSWKITSDPSTPAEYAFESEETVEKIGEIWIRSRGWMPMADGRGHYESVLGFDPKLGKFVGNWIGTMMHHHWVYLGELTPDGKSLVLTSEGPAFDGSDQMQTYRDIITVHSPDHRTLTSEVLGEDGEWQRFMTTHQNRESNLP